MTVGNLEPGRFVLVELYPGPYHIFTEDFGRCLMIATVLDGEARATYQLVVEIKLDDGSIPRTVSSLPVAEEARAWLAAQSLDAREEVKEARAAAVERRAAAEVP